MEILRCLISDIPHKILADIVQMVAQQDRKIEVVGQLPDLLDVPEVLERESIDVLIVGMQKDEPPALCQELLEKFPALLVIGLVDDGRMAVICKADVGSSQLVKAILLLSCRGNSDG